MPTFLNEEKWDVRTEDFKEDQELDNVRVIHPFHISSEIIKK